MGTTTTPNLGLIKPDGVELASGFDEQHAANMNILDALDPRIDTLETFLAAQQLKVKTSNQVVNNSVALVADTQLVFAGITAGDYMVELMIAWSAATAADFKWRLNFTAAITASRLWWGSNRDNTSSPAFIMSSEQLNNDVAIAGDGVANVDALLIKGGLRLNGTGGLAFQFAQNTANASDATVYAGSYAILRKVV